MILGIQSEQYFLKIIGFYFVNVYIFPFFSDAMVGSCLQLNIKVQFI